MSLEQAKRATELLNRTASENATNSAQELKLDNTNKVSFPGFPYKFEALNEKILVSIDIFKSGYECKRCKGKGHFRQQCECVTAKHIGFKYGKDELEEIKISLGEAVAQAREQIPCPECCGDYKSKEKIIDCTECSGRGALLVLPENSKNLPTTGVVVSMGSIARAHAEYKIGDRILFGPYAGNMIPTKAGLMFKSMDWNQAWTKIEGADDLGAFDFIIQE